MLPPYRRVVGFGASILDFVASVKRFPQPDEKIRSETFDIQGGGNCGNTLTCLKRLGVPACVMVTKVGSDPIGAQTIQLMRDEGIDTGQVLVREGLSSAFTYIIVDQHDATRTCIHTPTEEYLESELNPTILDGADLLHLDGRHTAAAIQLAKWANERGVPVVLDCEKDRPLLALLLPLADYIVTSSSFPSQMTNIAEPIEAAMHALMHMCGRVRVLVTTRGSKGSLMMIRAPSTPPDATATYTSPLPPPPPPQSGPIFSARSPRSLPSVVSFSSKVDELPQGSIPLSIRVDQYIPASCPTNETHPPFDIIHCSAWPLERSVVDTTGCGDTFIGAFIYGLLYNLSPAKTLALGSFVAGQKCLKPGARQGIPRRSNIPPNLL
mmetsp:Transcript_18621/g.30619  ORF Transcript_18621/g.30619 Transcript_18621/m.30619 type:complete len:381 (+) Transcript_18621:75-1217(+)